MLYPATHPSTAAWACSKLGLVEEVGPERAVEPLDLPVLIRRRRRGQAVLDPVLAAELVEQHLPALAEPVGELLAVVGQDLLGHPERDQRLRQ